MRFFVFLAALILAGNVGAQNAPMDPQLDAVWYGNGFTVTNNSDFALGDEWEIWVNGLPRVTKQAVNTSVKVVDAGGTLSTMHPTEFYKPLGAGEKLDICWEAEGEQRSNVAIPEGMFIVIGGETFAIPVVAAKRIPAPDNGVVEYERNAEVARVELTQADFIPTAKSVEKAGNTSVFAKSVRVYGDFSGEVKFLGEKLREIGATVADKKGKTAIRFVRDESIENIEGYTLEISSKGVTISASGAAGAFYGATTLLDMLRGQKLPAKLDNMTITDWPDFGFRGQHFDTARNYTSKEGVLKIIDLLAAYKLNVFHFHFSDDEGWRVEIPGLPELTEIGSRRGYTTDESDMIVPAYSGGGDASTAVGSGHLTRQDYIDILRYAKERHIWVIPEIESPGHARAAVVAMTARYNKYKDTDRAKAEEFMLREFDDKSIYRSIQDFDDNVMNVALPGTYRFMEHVVDELIAMYKEADAKLEIVHTGGDEVPKGVWSGSASAARFMADNNIDGVVELADYYVLRVNDILKARGLKIAGWQELVEGRSEKFRAAVKDNVGYVNVWSTNGAQGETPYRLVNQGYPVVLSNVGSLYFDLAYSNHPDERGQFWGGFIDAQRPFAMQPFNIYSSIWRDDNGKLVDNSEAGIGLTHANDETAEKLILGMQGQLWAEMIRDFDTATRLLLPKLPGLAERAWNSRPAWHCGKCFLRDWSRHIAVMAQREMPWWASQGIAFRLPPPGIYIEGGVLYANSMIEGAEIRYTTDGSVPTQSSPLWTKPVECNSPRVEARIFYLGQESVSSAFDNRKNAYMQ